MDKWKKNLEKLLEKRHCEPCWLNRSKLPLSLYSPLTSVRSMTVDVDLPIFSKSRYLAQNPLRGSRSSTSPQKLLYIAYSLRTAY